MARYDKLLKHFQHSKALDAAMEVGGSVRLFRLKIQCCHHAVSDAVVFVVVVVVVVAAPAPHVFGIWKLEVLW